MTSKPLKRYADMIGTVSAGLCLVHCLTIPLLFALAVVLPDLPEKHWHLLHYLFIGLAALAVHQSASRNRYKKLNNMMWMALIVFALALSLHGVFPWMVIVSACASLVLMTLHIICYSRSHKRQD